MPHRVRLVADLAGPAEHRRNDRLRRTLGDEHGDVVGGVGGDDLAARPRAVEKESRIVVAPSTTCSAVRIAPLAFTITPVPSPPSALDDGRVAWIWTSDGRICW